MEEIYMSKKGYQKLLNELEKLKERKKELSAEISETMNQGDLRENAGYTYAKERQAETLRRIDEIQDKLKQAKLLDNLEVNRGQAHIGATVKIKDLETQQTFRYTLAGSEEANPLEGTISVESPLAKAILGRKEGESFSAVLPKGIKQFRLIKLEYK